MFGIVGAVQRVVGYDGLLDEGVQKRYDPDASMNTETMVLEQALPSALERGYREFRGSRFAEEQARYRSLAEQGQSPETLVIACCDSRAAPELIFNARPGEIFVIRNVANLMPPYTPDNSYHSTSAALEFAVQSLKVKHIVVLGHGRCGGIHAALNPSEEPLSPGDFIGKWMELLGPATKMIAKN
ncbi:MAG: carbonic anhydrase [Gammaproteobacteria bacterium]